MKSVEEICIEAIRKKRENDLILAITAAEFAFRCAEKGHNLETTLSKVRELMDGREARIEILKP